MNDVILNAYNNATKRLFLLDYDGTLAEIALTPLEAKPKPELLEILEKLSDNPQNTIVIVSGRRHEELDVWLGQLPIFFVAEHGLLAKDRDGEWVPTMELDTSWKEEVQPLVERYHERIKGSLVENKTNAIVWHYRTAEDTAEAETAEKELFAELEPICNRLGLKLMRGKMIIEVMPKGYDKGSAVKFWQNKGNWDFMLVAGDDTTDEDMFKAAPETALTTKIGAGETVARLHINSPAEMRGLLDKLAVS